MEGTTSPASGPTVATDPIGSYDERRDCVVRDPVPIRTMAQFRRWVRRAGDVVRVTYNARVRFRWAVRGDATEDVTVDPIVDQLIYPGGKFLLVSAPKAGKSFFALALCGALRQGEPFLGLATEPTRVLYLTEEPATTFDQKLDRFGIAPGDDGFRFLRRSQSDVVGRPWREIAADTHAAAKASGAELVVVDVLHRWADFGDEGENRSGVVREAIAALDPLTEDGIAVLILHHATWAARRARGSTDIQGAVDNLLFLERTDDAATVESQGGRFPILERLSYRLGVSGHLEPLGSERPKAAGKTAQVVEAIERLGGGSISTPELAAVLGWSDRVTLKWAERAARNRLLAREVGPSNVAVWRKRRRREWLTELLG